jgi:hypothetical protein
MAQAFGGINKKVPGVWQVFRMKNYRVVDHQRGIDRGLARMGPKTRIPVMQLALLVSGTVLAYSALSNQVLVATVGASLQSLTAQLEVLGVVAAVTAVFVFLFRSGRLGRRGKA